MEHTWYVYVHTNILNGKKYVGITCQKPEDRWRNGNGYKQCSKMWNAIMKYGWEGFDHEIVAKNLSKEQADKMEKDLIKKYNTIEAGYNLDIGGGGKEPEIVETRQARSDSSLRIKKPHVGHHNSTYIKRKVRCVETGEVYESVSSLARLLNVDHSRILKACNFNRAICGFHYEYVDERKNNLRKILCKDLNIVFDSIASAARYFNVAENTVRRHCENGLLIEGHNVTFA